MNVNGPISRQAVELCSYVADTTPCIEGRIAEETIAEGVEALAAAAEDEIGRERTGRIDADVEAAHLRGMVHELDAIVWTADVETGRYTPAGPTAATHPQSAGTPAAPSAAPGA